jgi:hypothetical protein
LIILLKNFDLKPFLIFIVTILLNNKWTSGQTGIYNYKQVGLIANAIMGSFYEVPDGFQQNADMGWSAGIYYGIGVRHFCLMPELLFTQRNFSFNQSFNSSAAGYSFDGKLALSHMLLNINFLYAPQLNSKIGFLAGGGPYLGYGLSARREQTETLISGGSTQTSHVEDNLGFGENGAQRAEYGVQAILGMIMADKIIIRFAYAINARRVLTESQEFRIHMFQLGAGYNIIRKAKKNN